MKKKIPWIIGLAVLAGLVVIAIILVSKKGRNAEVIANPEIMQEAGQVGVRSETAGRPNGQTVTSKDGVTITQVEGGTIKLEAGGKKIPFSRVLAMRAALKCTVVQHLDDYKIQAKGTVYMNEGMMRGDFAAEYQDMPKIDVYTIIRDGFAYNWTSLKTMGYKTAVVLNDGALETGVTVRGNNYVFNTDQVGDYTCFDWKPDNSLFTVPADIGFYEVK